MNEEVSYTTVTVDYFHVVHIPTADYRWVKRGWFRKVLQRASVTQYGDVWWDDVSVVSEGKQGD